MARNIKRLSPPKVSAFSDSGYYADGGGLYLQISKSGTKSWVFRFTLNGRKREMGLGPLYDVSLAQARDHAARCRAFLREGVDPIDERRRRKIQASNEQDALRTFKECAEDYINLHDAQWSNSKHAQQWRNTLRTYAYPEIGQIPVGLVDTHHIKKILTPIWSEKTETATRLRQRIEAVLDAARVEGLREGENPARWKGHLDKILPKPSKVRKIERHAALPYPQIGGFMIKLRERESIAARGLEFIILTAARTGEVLGAKFDEIDLENAVWVVPAERMKAGKEHRVPLSRRAVEIVRAMTEIKQSDFVFPGQRGGALSNMAFLQQLKRMGRGDLTAHGFRSTFRDWAAEQTAYPGDVVEMALAHAIKNQTEAAYRRGDLFEKRRRLMDDWCEFCSRAETGGGEVVPIRDAR